jgi:hypothetical protein
MKPQGLTSSSLTFVRPPGTPDYSFRKRGRFGMHVFNGVPHSGVGPLVHRIIQADMNAMAKRLSSLHVPMEIAAQALQHEQKAGQPKRKSKPCKNPTRRGVLIHKRVEKAVKTGTKVGGAPEVVRKALARENWVIEKAEEPCNWSAIKVGTPIDLVCRHTKTGRRALFNLKTTQSSLSRLMTPQPNQRFAGQWGAAVPASMINAYHCTALGEVTLWKKCFPTLPVDTYGIVLLTNDQRAFVIETPPEIKALEGQMERDMIRFKQ